MSQKSMPGLLVVLVILMALSTLLNLVNGSILSAVIGGALLFGVLVGNNGVRTFLRALAVFQLGFALFAVLVAGALGANASPLLMFAIVLGIGVPAFYFYTLGRDDVRDWMFRKSFHVDDNDVPQL